MSLKYRLGFLLCVCLFLSGCADQSPQKEMAKTINLKVTQQNEKLDAPLKMDLAHDDMAYLRQLGLMRGHLYVGYQLYKAGHTKHAKTHMKHPESELYVALIPAFKARHVEGFASELKALADAINSEKSNKNVAHAYENLMIAIAKAEDAVRPSSQTTQAKLQLIIALLKVAGEEYGLAVVNGHVREVHEYQDALGFTVIAGSIIRTIQDNPELKDRASELVKSIAPLWPSLIPPKKLNQSADQIYAVVDKLEKL